MSTESLCTDSQSPDGWREAPLISVAEPRFSNVDKITISSEQPVRLCNYIDVYNNDYITPDLQFMEASATEREIDRFGLSVGDVIITKDSETPNDIGISSIVDYAAPDLVCGYHLALIRPNKEAVDPTFLGKQLAQSRLAKYFGRMANGITRYGLPTTAIKSAPIWLPRELDEQIAIGSTLRLVDKAIAKAETVIVKLRWIRAGLLQDLMTRGLNEHGELRDPIRYPEQFQDSPLGHIPKEWTSGELDDLVSPDRPIVYGILMPGRGFRDGVPVIKVKDIRDGQIDVSELLLTDPRIDEAYRRSRVRAGDLLFTIRGTVGRMAFVPVSLDNANITQDTARVSLNHANPMFVARWLETEIPSRFIDVHTIGVAVRGINLRDVRKIPVAVPLKPEQDAIATVILNAEKTIESERGVLACLIKLKSGLVNDLLTGRVRVPESIGVSA